MGEDITNTVASETQQISVSNEENTAVDQQPQVDEQEQVNQPVENSNQEQSEKSNQEEEGKEEKNKPSYEDLQKKKKITFPVSICINFFFFAIE